MEKRKLWASLIFTAFTLVVLCATLTVSTYAWFTFDPYTNVTPMEGKISDGDTNLLISLEKDTGYDKKCELKPEHMADTLYPVSSIELEKFYTSKAQKDKISIQFKDVTEEPEKWLIHGTVYLKSLGTGRKVYFNKETLNFGEDPQVLAACRLGLKITVEQEEPIVLIFKLDDMGSTAGAGEIRTVSATGDVVVASVNSDDTPNYKEDPANNINDYTLDEVNEPKELCTLKTEEVAEVEYWFYMEGCDDHCSNPVQNKDLELVLGFQGEKYLETENT